MHHASIMVLPVGARPPYRPATPPGGPAGSPDLPGTWGIRSRRDLLAAGCTDARLRTLVGRGTLERVAPSWYATSAAEPDVRRALAGLARLTCVDALRLRGAWVPPGCTGASLHVYRPRSVAPLLRNAVPHAPGLRSWPERDAVASSELAIAHALRCLTADDAAVVIESSLRRGLVDPAALEHLVAAAPWHVRHRLGALSTASDSGSETRVVRWLRRRGFRVEQQVYVDGVGFLDAYAGGVFLEIDGREHHASPEAFTRDRRRDLEMHRQGLEILRLSYAQVWFDWDRTQDAVLETIRALGPAGRRVVDRMLGARRGVLARGAPSSPQRR